MTRSQAAICRMIDAAMTYGPHWLWWLRTVEWLAVRLTPMDY